MNEKTYGLCPYIIDDNSIKILLCKSADDKHSKWGFVKGGKDKDESPKDAAKREFYEECGIKIQIKYYEEYFEQFNDLKDIGIWLVNAKNIKNFEKFFDNNLTLKGQYLSLENSEVKFFKLTELPDFKEKQRLIALRIVSYLTDL